MPKAWAERTRKSLGAPEAGKKNRPPDFVEPSPVKLGELDRETMTQLNGLVRHPLESIFGEHHAGEGIRVLVLEGVVELVEVPIRQKVRLSGINDEPGRILKSSSGMKMRQQARKGEAGLNEKETTVGDDRENRSKTGVDTGLVAMFLKMTPEERLRSNDNVANTIMEMRDAFREGQIPGHKSGRSA